jgi:hypothetical protein
MTVKAKPEGMESGELMFVLSDPDHRYSLDQVVEILNMAQDMGLPLDEGTFVEHMTVRQLEALVRKRGNCDA